MNFQPDTLVAWATKKNTFMGSVISGNSRMTIVLIISTAKPCRDEGKKVAIPTRNLGRVVDGKAKAIRL